MPSAGIGNAEPSRPNDDMHAFLTEAGNGAYLPGCVRYGANLSNRHSQVIGSSTPIPAIRASVSESGTATDARRSAQCILVAPSTLALPSAPISPGPLRLPQCCFRLV